MSEEQAQQVVEESTTPVTEEQQTVQSAEEAPPEGEQEQKVEEAPSYYTNEEIESILAEDGVFDRKRLTPEQMVIYKTFERGTTKKFQDAAKLRREAEEILARAKQSSPDPYYDDPEKNRLFGDYIKDPVRFNSIVNSEIARLEGVEPITDDGMVNPQFKQARQTISQWMQIKDEFSFKREGINESRRERDRVQMQLGTNAEQLLAYAKAAGFSENEFIARPEIRELVKRDYERGSAVKSADGKKVVKLPPKLANQGGGGNNFQPSKDDEFDPSLSTEERIARGRARRLKEFREKQNM